MALNVYSGSIGPYAAAGYVAGNLLKRLLPLLTFEQFMNAEVLPTNNTKTMQWRRFFALPPAMKPLTEGVTPNSLKLSAQEYTAVLDQYGSVVEVSDVTIQTSQDKIIQDLSLNMAEQAAQTIERVRYNVLKACVNKFYPGGATLRSQVNSPLDSTTHKMVMRALKRQNAREITQIGKSTVNFGTESIEPAYIAIGHVDLDDDIKAIAGFTNVKDYGAGVKVFPGEIGAVGKTRFITTNICSPYPDAGGLASTNGTVTTGGVNSDVYPLIYLSQDCCATVALKGMTAVAVTLINADTPDKSDPLGQVMKAGWKTYSTAVIQNHLTMAVAEVAATELS